MNYIETANTRRNNKMNEVKEKIISEEDYGSFQTIIKELQIGNETWRYSISGNGGKLLLALPANMGGHYSAFPLIDEVHTSYTIIALSVPPLPKFELSAQGLATIIAHEKFTCCDAIGHSNGGVHIQNLIKHYPKMVDKVIFSHSLTSMSKEDAYQVNDTELRFYKKTKIVIKMLPLSLVLSIMGGKFAKAIRLKSGEKYSLNAQMRMKEDLKLLSKKDVTTIIDCMEDFIYNHTFSSEDYTNKSVLLLNSPTDKLVNEKQKIAMRKLCINAEEYSFEKGGHTPMLSNPKEYYNIVKNFLID